MILLTFNSESVNSGVAVVFVPTSFDDFLYSAQGVVVGNSVLVVDMVVSVQVGHNCLIDTDITHVALYVFKYKFMSHVLQVVYNFCPALDICVNSWHVVPFFIFDLKNV